MIKDNFYNYGFVSKLLVYLITNLVLILYISRILKFFYANCFITAVYFTCSFIILVILIIRFIWRRINILPMSYYISKAKTITFRIAGILVFLLLFVIVFTDLLNFMLNVYFQYNLDINNKIDYKIFGIVIIPFKYIQLFGYILENTININIIKLQNYLLLINQLFGWIFPIIAIIYLLQLRIYRKQYNS